MILSMYLPKIRVSKYKKQKLILVLGLREMQVKTAIREPSTFNRTDILKW